MSLQHTIKAFIREGEKYYVAECLEIPVVTQGKPLTKRFQISKRRHRFI